MTDNEASIFVHSTNFSNICLILIFKISATVATAYNIRLRGLRQEEVYVVKDSLGYRMWPCFTNAQA